MSVPHQLVGGSPIAATTAREPAADSRAEGRAHSRRRRPPRVLLVGAYERDNFGDLLFWVVTTCYLRDAELITSAPFAADMTELLGEQVRSYGPVLRDEEVDVIWTVGGQIGRIGLDTAYKLSADPDQYAEFAALPPTKRAAILRDQVGGGDIISPYMPSPTAFAHNIGAITVVNSAGFGGIERVQPGRRARLEGLLRGHDLLAVRDLESAQYLTELGIRHRLVPDAVHAISHLHPVQRDPDPQVTLVQAARADLARHGHDKLAAGLLATPQLRGYPIRFLLAGTATGHDSVEDYERVIEHLRRRDPGVDVDILTDRDPLLLVRHIAAARIVIGTSLHVRIVACSYQVPRVSLTRPKAAKYARLWDAEFPHGVQFDGVPAAVQEAFTAAEDPEAARRSAALSHLAHEHTEDLAKRALRLARCRTTLTDRRRAWRRRAYLADAADQAGRPGLSTQLAAQRFAARRAVKHTVTEAAIVHLPRALQRPARTTRRRLRRLWWNRSGLLLLLRARRMSYAHGHGETAG